MTKPFQLRKIFSDLYTLFLFTQSDIRTALLPVTLFSIAAAPLAIPIQLLETTFWIWLHLLQCNVANQIKEPDEDKINKPFRPIPSGRITVEDATILRWALVPICLVYSALYSMELMQISLTLMLFTVWYNERDGDKDSLSKNFLTAVMYGISELGGTLVAGRDRTQVSPTGRIAAEMTVAVFMSTLHAQDFKDADGDRLTGRRTFPIAYPVASRFAIGLAIPLWSILLTVMWELDPLCAIAFVGYGCYVGARFMLYRTVQDDKLSCKHYCAWFSIHHLFPAYWYYHHGANQYPNLDFVENILTDILRIAA
ncbi:UbiA prenyltransferase family-domain-containing protein [Pisolithus orientalis]|uniref:UbiA prenyltransferase family-domain-containing protein n=1 Tax=Pisolithus orientalis TaxID=936130 RepID=UPI0022248763|nr:UbiA prenyltransferase family-domain-containing protein [Pisolithus orientalis]KAI6004486.1 UbiA prenyltransferase family-domain-containing protein [Pisolithus orientalis]